MPRVFKPALHSRIRIAAIFALPAVVIAGQPFESATVTRVENKVAFGENQNGKTTERPAALKDVIKAKDYLTTQSESRAELQFADHSLVRIGQNSVFSFDADSRTLSLEKGAMLFYITPGSGGGKIKTPSMTAAVTGTVGLVTSDVIVCLRGVIHTKFGDVPAGYAVDSSGNIFKFDWKGIVNGALVNFGGPPPTFPLTPPLGPETGDLNSDLSEFPGLPDFRWLDIEEATQINPRIRDFLNTPQATPTPTPEPTPVPTPQPRPTIIPD